MRACFITGEYPPMEGGVGDYTSRLAGALASLGVEVHVLADARASAEPSGDRAAGAGGVSVHPLIRRWSWRSWGVLRKALAALRPDVVHLQYQAAAYAMHPVANLLPWLVRRSSALAPSRPAVVTTFHDLLVPYLFPKAGPLRRQAVMTLARCSDAVVATNEEDWRQLRRYPSVRSLSLIPIGSNIARQPPAGYDRAAWRKQLGVAARDVLLCYFGFLSEAKGGEALVRALALLESQEPGLVPEPRPHSYRLLMVGGQVGDSDPTNRIYLGRVESLIHELGLADRVLWSGYVTPPQVSANLLAADIAVLPYIGGANLRHGSLHACLAHGLPIVTTRPPGHAPSGRVPGGGPGDVVGPAASGGSASDHVQGPPALSDGGNVRLVEPGDPRALAGAIAALAGAPEQRARLGAGAQRLAAAFTWDGIAQRHLDVYRSLLTGERSGSALR